MSGKYLNELTGTELRYECRQRGISDAGTKDALEIRLTQYFADRNLQANAIRFQPMETHRRTGSDSETSQVRHTGPPETTPDEQTPDLHPLDKPNPPPTHTQQQATDMIQTARGMLKEVRESGESSPHRHSLESRLAMLEDCMVRFGDDQRRIAETMRRLEMGMARQTSDHTDVLPPTRPLSATLSGQHRTTPETSTTGNTRAYTHPGAPFNTDYGMSCPAARDSSATGNQHADRTVHFENSANLFGAPSSTHNYTAQQSTLIPYDEVCAARYSLPEFHGTTPEDPVRFIHKAESILYQTRIDRSAWTNIIVQQLKGAASTWWNTIRLLDFTWDEFRAEFLEKFDNVDIQSRLRADIVSVRQSPTQSLTEFVTQKNQLARRINTGLTEIQLVGTIAGLTRNEYRTHIRLQRPATFADLRRIAGVLDYAPDETAPPPQQKPDYKKPGRPSAPTHRSPPRQRTQDGAAEKPRPPNPCKYCGGPHWNSDCPEYPRKSGNGK